MKEISVSIIVGEYNSSAFIRKNVESLLEQDYNNIEILLYDDASTDNTREIMRELEVEHPDKIRIFVSDINGGVGKGRNYCLNRAEGDYILFMDHDDYIDRSYVSTLVREAEKSEDVDVFYTGFTSVEENGDIRYVRKFRTEEEAFRQSIPLFAKMYRRNFLVENNIYSCEGRVIEDILYQGVLEARRPKIKLVDYPKYYYVFNRKSIKNTVFLEFQNGIIDKSFDYLIRNKNLLSQESYEIASYYAFYFVCWYLLKTGAYVKKENMDAEYSKAFGYLDRHFAEYRNNKYLTLRGLKGSRMVVNLALKTVSVLDKLDLSKWFFGFYAKNGRFFRKFWPEL